MRDIRRTFQIHSNLTPWTCPECQAPLDTQGRVDEAINHMLSRHGWNLLHIGSEADRDERGQSISHTVAMLGTRDD